MNDLKECNKLKLTSQEARGLRDYWQSIWRLTGYLEECKSRERTEDFRVLARDLEQQEMEADRG